VRVATWNVNGLRARLAFVLEWLRARQPDLVALQELKLADGQFPHAELEAAGYRVAVHGQKGWNGVAILSRTAAEVTQIGLPGQEAQGARLLAARAGGLAFASVYVPNGKSVGHEDFPRKLAWLDALAGHLEREPCERTLVGGDFNVCPGPLDTWNEEALRGTVFHTDEERARFRRLLDRGLCDVFRDRFPDARTFSWWDYRGGAFHRRQGLRLDFLLASADVMARVRAVEIDREWRKKHDGLTPSDHAPVFADLGEAAVGHDTPVPPSPQ
jgi:exodeoxyribonuclease-3